MKKIITMIVIIAVAFTFTMIPVSAASKYVKVKKTTYNKIKKQNKKYKKEIGDYKATVSDAVGTINRLNKNLEEKEKELEKVKEELESQKSMNKWMWNSIYSMGMSYKGKVWTVPAEFPESFIMDGVKYTVKTEVEK